jgi:hypothetical protein
MPGSDAGSKGKTLEVSRPVIYLGRVEDEPACRFDLHVDLPTGREIGALSFYGPSNPWRIVTTDNDRLTPPGI